jgi:phosphoribosylanthranilate isomerase
MRVKICGITNLEDALYAIDQGADALGFVFYAKSPRYVSPQTVEVIVKQLPPFIEKVALFVNETPQTINTIMQTTQMTLAQLHFDVDDLFLGQLDYPYIRVIRAQNATDIQQFSHEYRLIDAFVESYGGAGKRVDLSWFDGVDKSKIILAGGLNPENLDEIHDQGFYGVDVSSGVEASLGKKSFPLVKAFIQKAKSTHA